MKAEYGLKFQIWPASSRDNLVLWSLWAPASVRDSASKGKVESCSRRYPILTSSHVWVLSQEAFIKWLVTPATSIHCRILEPCFVVSTIIFILYFCKFGLSLFNTIWSCIVKTLNVLRKLKTNKKISLNYGLKISAHKSVVFLFINNEQYWRET